MKNDDLIDVWESTNQNKIVNNQQITKEMIENYLKPKVSKEYLSFNISILITLAAFIAGIIVFSINTYIYSRNSTMFNLEMFCLGLSILFFIYGIYIFVKLREINNFSNSLVELLSKKISFLRKEYEVWLVIISIGMTILVFGINSLIDNEGGTYKINNITSYVLVNLIVFGFVYTINKIATSISVKKMKVYIQDLQDGVLDNSKKEETGNAKNRIVFVIVSMLLTALILLGILKMLRII